MIKIRRKDTGWRMTFSHDGHWFAVQARSVNEMQMALAHYYGTGSERGHHIVGSRRATCPLCANIEAIATKKAR